MHAVNSSVTSEPSSVDPFQISAASPRTAARRLTKDGRGRRGRGGEQSSTEMSSGKSHGVDAGRARGRKPHNSQLDHPLAWNAGTNTRVREGGGREGEEGGRRAELLVAETLPARVIEHQRTAHSGRRGPVPCREAYVPLLGLPASPASVRRPRRSAPACAAAPATAPATASATPTHSGSPS